MKNNHWWIWQLLQFAFSTAMLMFWASSINFDPSLVLKVQSPLQRLTIDFTYSILRRCARWSNLLCVCVRSTVKALYLFSKSPNSHTVQYAKYTLIIHCTVSIQFYQHPLSSAFFGQYSRTVMLTLQYFNQPASYQWLPSGRLKIPQALSNQLHLSPVVQRRDSPADHQTLLLSLCQDIHVW